MLEDRLRLSDFLVPWLWQWLYPAINFPKNMRLITDKLPLINGGTIDGTKGEFGLTSEVALDIFVVPLFDWQSNNKIPIIV